MCEATTILAAMTAASRAADDAVRGTSTSARLRATARGLERQARSVRRVSASQEAAARRATRAALGSLVAGQSASGVRAGIGSPLDAQTALVQERELQTLTDRAARETRARSLESRAALQRSNAARSLLGGALSATTHSFSGARGLIESVGGESGSGSPPLSSAPMPQSHHIVVPDTPSRR